MTALDQIERQLREAVAARRRRRRPRPLVLVTSVAAGIAAVVLVLGGAPSRDDEREVSTPPAPFLAPDPDKIVYVRARTVHTDKPGTRDVFVLEEWHRGRETHRIDIGTNADGSTGALDHVIDANGVMRQIAVDRPAGSKAQTGGTITGDYRVFRASQGGDAANVIASEQAGYLADFRARLAESTLDRSQSLTFAGRPARRYHLPPERHRVDPDRSYFVDRVTGAPLGFISRPRFSPTQVSTSTQTVESIQILDPTPENLAELRTLTFKRR